MSFNLSKKSLLKKAAQVSMLTFLSRIFGFIREMLSIQYFGVSALSDAFITAFRIPNFFRHVFAEGALNASFVPVIVKTVNEGNRKEANGLMTLSFLFFEGIILLIYFFVLLKTEWVVRFLAPGFSPEQLAHTIPFLRILFSFLLFISSSALLGGALNAVNHFFAPAFASPLLNIVFIISLVMCLKYNLTPDYLCWGIIGGACLQFMMHLAFFFKHNFTFGAINAASMASFGAVMSRFLPALFGVSIFEINLFVSGIIASFLPKGSITLLHYGARLMNIPLGIFAVALSSILLPHFSRLVLHAPKRLPFYLLESIKLITWIIFPTTILLLYTSENLFGLLLRSRATPEVLYNAKWVLMIYVTGLLFLCINKILLSVFYALKDTRSPAFASGLSAGVNIAADLIGMYFFGVFGIAAANTISACTMTLTCFVLLHKKHGILFYFKPYLVFFIRYLSQLLVSVMILTSIFYSIGFYQIKGIGFWLTTTSFMTILMLLLLAGRRLCSINLYFLRK